MTERVRRRLADVSLAGLAAGLVASALGSGAVADVRQISIFPTSSCMAGASFLASGPDGNVWFQSGVGFSRIDPSGTVTEFAVPGHGVVGFTGHPTTGPDGYLWYTDFHGHVGKMTPSGAPVASYVIPGDSVTTDGIAAGADGNLWFIEDYESMVGRITPSGVVTTYPTPTSSSYPTEITAGPDGNLWFLEGTDRIGRVTLSGPGAPLLTEYPVGRTGTGLTGIASGPDGNVWFTETSANRIGRISPDGSVTDFGVPTSKSGLSGITSAPDGNLWFTEKQANQLGTITTSGSVTEQPLPPSTNPASIVTGADGNLWFSARDGVARYPLSGIAPPAPPAPMTHGETGGDGSSLLAQPLAPVPCGDAVVGPGRTHDYLIPATTNGTNDSITGVVLDVSATTSTASGFLSVYPTGQPRPPGAQLGFTAGTPARAEVTVPAGPGGEVTVYNSAGDTRVDLQVVDYLVGGAGTGGHQPPTAGLYVPLAAQRIVDTRAGSGLQGDGVDPQPGTGFPIVVNGADGLPADQAFTAILNVGVLHPAASGTLELANSPSRISTTVAMMDFAAGRTTARRLLVPGGALTATLQGSAADVTVDLVGYFTGGAPTDEGQMIHPVSSSPIEDTASGSGLPGAGQTMGPGGQLSVQVAGTSVVPSTSNPQRPSAALLDVAVSSTSADGALTVGASGSARPAVPDLLWTAGDAPSNLVVVPLGVDGQVTLYNDSGSANVRVAVAGWMSAGTDADLAVTSPTTTTLSSSAGTSASGAPVTLTATVTSVGGSPSGTVTFVDGTSVLGTALLSSGQASLTISSLAPGTHGVSAGYGGDAGFGSSTSPALSVVVTAAPSPSPHPSGTPGPTASPNGLDTFVQGAYNTLLGHDADPSSLQSWVNAISGGTPRSTLGWALATSSEYRTDVIGGTSGTQDFYRLYLHRAADQGGIAYWVGRMAGIDGPRLTFEQVRLNLVGSWEFFNVTNSGDPGTIIDALYQDILGRAPEASGKQYWLNHFNVNTIASQFLYSEEGRAYLVSNDYRAILNRAADAPGLSYWTAAMLTGASDEDIISSVLGSEEYFLNH